MKKIILFAFILAMSVSGYAFGASSEAIINVVNSYPSNYPEDGYDTDTGEIINPGYALTIEEALEKAETFAGEDSSFADVNIVLQINITPESTIEFDGSNYASLTSVTITGAGRTINLPVGEGRHFNLRYSGMTLTINNAVLAGNSTAGGITISDGEAVFTEVTFRGNAATEEDDDGNTSGGAVLLTGTGKAAFTGCTFSSNSAANGGAIYSSSTGSITFTDTNTFATNTATNGAGIYAAWGSEFVSTGTLAFNQNTAEENGGAVYVSSGAEIASTGFTFTGNTAGNDGGAVYLAEASTATAMTVTGTFTGNTAGNDGGAIYISSGQTLTLSGTVTFTGNTATSGNGGAIYVTGTGIIANDSATVTFRENSASYASGGADSDVSDFDSGWGGALCMEGTETITLGAGSFISNTGSLGGAVYISSGTISFADTAAWNSNKSYYGGGIYASGGTLNFTGGAAFTSNEAEDSGGALYVTGSTESLTFSSTPVFTSNRANTDAGSVGDGGAVWWGVLLSKFPSSGEFTSNSTSGIISGGEIDGDAGKGGAIFIAGADTKEILTLTSDYTFSGNTAFNKGGAVYTNSPNTEIILDGVEYTSQNTARYFNGGLINSARAKVTVQNSTIRNQKANTYGGAIYGENIIITNSTFESNISEHGHGGAVYAGKDADAGASDDDESVLTIESSVFRYNLASDRTNGSGGAITAGEAEVTINNSYFTENAAGHSGGAIYLDQNCTNSAITQSTFTSNGTDGSTVNTQYGGAIRTESPLSVSTSYFLSNSATASGGALYFARNSSGSASISITSSMFRRNISSGSGNESTYGGGAVYLDMDTADIMSSTFDSNIARGTSGVMGGAIYIRNSRESNIQNSTFTDNQVSGTDSCGGGIAIAGTSRVNVTSCTLTASSLSGGNTAVHMGGGIYVASAGNLSIGGTIVVGNSANYGGDICSLGECSSSSLGFNRVGKFSGDSSTGTTSWTAQPNRADTDRSNENWTKDTFFGEDGKLSDNIIDSEKPPFIGSDLADDGQVRLQTIMLNEDVTLADDNRATNIIDTSYSSLFPRYDERGADRWSTGVALDIGAVMFDGTIPGKPDEPITSYTIQSVTMSGIPNTLRSIGQTASLIALVRYTNGRTAYGGNDTGSEPVTWSSSNQNIVRIDQNGNITALAVTPNNSYVTISVRTNRNTAVGSPATDSRPVRVLGQYSYLNISSVYQNYLAQYITELAEHDIAISLTDVSSSGVKSSSFQRAFKAAWTADKATQITDLTSSAPEFSTYTSYNASGYVPSKKAAANINFQNRNNGDVFPVTYSWTFTGSEIKALTGYDLSEKTLNANLAGELFKSLRIDFQGASKNFQVVGGSGVSAKDAYSNQALTLTKADGNKGVKIELTAYLANVNAAGTNSETTTDGPQLMGSGSRKLLVVPDGTDDGAITGSMWMIQKGSSSSEPSAPEPSTPETPDDGKSGSKSGGSGGGGGCDTFSAGIALALIFMLRRKR